MKQKSIFLLMLLLSSMSPLLSRAYVFDGIYYDLDKETLTASVSKAYNTKTVSIPESIIYYYYVDDIQYSQVYTVTSIGDNAFKDCESLSSVTIPNTVTSIGNSAFSGCSSLPSIDIPNSVISIGNSAFLDCHSLSYIDIPNSVTSIGKCAFMRCRSLFSITISSSVTSIGDEIFDVCESLMSIKVDPQNKTYDSRENCNAIIRTSDNTLVAGCNSTIIPNSVTSIGYAAFPFCTSLYSITIPNSVTSISDFAFVSCNSLTTVKCEAQIPPTCGDYAFYGLGRGVKLYVYESAIDAYRTAPSWREFKNILPIEESRPTSATISITKSGATTFFYNYDLDFTGMEDIKAYVASGYNYNTGSVLLTRVYEVPANTGFMVTGSEGSYSIPCAEVKYAYANLFRGTMTETDLNGSEGGYSNYYLADGDEGLMFYLIEDSKTLSANSAYLHIPTNTSAESRTLNLSFADDSEVTGIDDVVDGGNSEQAPVYNLSGQRVAAPKNGLFVKNGKIVMLRL